VQKPLATVVIGGLLSATLLTLLVLPVLYFLFEKKGKANRKPPLASLLIILMGVPALARSQSTPVSGLQQLVDEALKNNAGLRAAGYEVGYYKALKRTSFDIGKTNLSVMHGQYNSLNTDNNISINQSIPFPTVFSNQAKLNQALVKGSELKQQVTSNELISQVKSAYYHWQYLQALRQLLSSQDSIYTAFLKASELRLKTGESNLIEKTTAETRLMEVKNLLAQNASGILMYQSQLQALVNGKQTIQPAREDLVKLEPALPSDSLAYARNPALAYLKQQVEISNRQQKLETARVLPDFNIGYFNQSLIGYQNVNGTDQYFDASKRFTGFQVGIAIPLWFVPQSARIKAAGVNRDVLQSNYEQYQVNMQTRYQQAIQEFLMNRNAITYYETGALPNAELLISQADAAFRNGDIGYVEYLQALKHGLSIKENYLLALNQYNQSVISLEFLTGNQ
jgi:cobalt-zinc-cadmium resistance protein CzcA